MKLTENISDGLKHVRTVHLTLLAVSLTVLYLVVFAWTDAPEVYKQLKDFEASSDKLQTDELAFIDLMGDKWRASSLDELLKIFDAEMSLKIKIYNELRPNKIKIDNELKPKILRKSIYLVNNDKIDKTKLNTPSAVLHDFRETLNRKDWNIKKISQIMISPEIKEEIKNWIEFNLKSQPKAGGVYAGEGPYLINLTGNWHSENKKKKKLIITLGIKKKYIQIVIGNWGTYTDIADLGTEVKNFSLNFKSTTEKIHLPEGWFKDKGYHRLETHWNELKDKTFPEAFELIKKEKADRLEGRKQSLLGVAISGDDMGYVGPIAIVLIFLYMLVFISHIKSFVEHNLSFDPEVSEARVSPWIGAMPGFFPPILTALTLAVLPALSAGLAIWRILGWLIISVTMAVILLLMGGYCVYIGIYFSKLYTNQNVRAET